MDSDKCNTTFPFVATFQEENLPWTLSNRNMIAEAHNGGLHGKDTKEWDPSTFKMPSALEPTHPNAKVNRERFNIEYQPSETGPKL